MTALVVATIAIRSGDPTGWLGTDDAAYYDAAEHVLTGETIQRVHQHYGRMIHFVPIAASVSVFGHHPWAVVLPTVVASVICVILVAILGRLLWGWWEGLCAATVVSMLPLFRVLSTVALPDVHACLWVTVAVILAIVAARADRPWIRTALALGAGLTLGFATSAKIFALTAGIAVAGACLFMPLSNRPRRMLLLGAAGCGFAAWFVMDGLFYLWIADDFFFKYHALAAAQGSDALFDAGHALDGASYVALAADRLSLLFRPSESYWGWLAVAFWPAVLVAFFKDSKSRVIALWAVAGYVAIALGPVRLAGGPRPMPIFHGRHILTTCVPFALCLAWGLKRLISMVPPVRAVAAADRVATPAVWAKRALPVTLLGITALAFVNEQSLYGLRHPHTLRVGQALEALIAEDSLGDDRPIILHPTLYIRHRILFPPQLRQRLRVSVDGSSPDWWRWAAVDMTSRVTPLLSPGDAYLIATPEQLNGESQRWDYGVTLPRAALAPWQHREPLLRIARFADRSIHALRDAPHDVRRVLIVLVGTPPAFKTACASGSGCYRPVPLPRPSMQASNPGPFPVF